MKPSYEGMIETKRMQERGEREARIIRMVPDPAVLKAAEELCEKAIAALAAYRSKKA
jgi:hypothetical protein